MDPIKKYETLEKITKHARDVLGGAAFTWTLMGMMAGPEHPKEPTPIYDRVERIKSDQTAKGLYGVFDNPAKRDALRESWAEYDSLTALPEYHQQEALYQAAQEQRGENAKSIWLWALYFGVGALGAGAVKSTAHRKARKLRTEKAVLDAERNT